MCELQDFFPLEFLDEHILQTAMLLSTATETNNQAGKGRRKIINQAEEVSLGGSRCQCNIACSGAIWLASNYPILYLMCLLAFLTNLPDYFVQVYNSSQNLQP